MTDTPDVSGMSDTSLLDFFIAVDNSDESLLQPMLAAVSAELRRRNLLDDHGVNEAGRTLYERWRQETGQVIGFEEDKQ